MHKILITAFSTNSDIISCGVLINSIVKNNPQTIIHVITYKENESVFEALTQISKIHFVDRSSIKQYFENPLFSDGFAINQFALDIVECLEINWNSIINYTNDNVSSYLIAALQADEKIGTTIANNGAPITSNRWASYLNYVNGTQPLHYLDNNFVRHHMTQIPIYKSGACVKVDENFSAVAYQNFQKIRQTKTNAKIIGISLLADDNSCYLDFHALKDLIDILESSESYRAVLLFNGNEKEREIINQLNKNFNNTLISINTDHSTFSAIAVHLDYIISGSNFHARIADLLETKLIQVGEDANVSYNTIGNYYVIKRDTMSWSNDCLFILNQELHTDLPVSSMNTSNPTFLTVEDETSTFRTQIRGPVDIQQELRYHIGRCYHMALLGYPVNRELVEHIKTATTESDLDHFVNQTKDELTDTVRILLATIRSLKTATQSKQNLHLFIGNLDTLISKGRYATLTAAAVALFEADLEKINSTSSEENMRSIEKRLFELKDDLQIFTNILSDLTVINKKVDQSIHKII